MTVPTRSGLALALVSVAWLAGCSPEAPVPPAAVPAAPATQVEPPRPPAFLYPPTVPPPGAKNCLVNPGFEQGEQGWMRLRAGLRDGVSVVGALAHDGSGACRMVVDSTGEGIRAFQGFLQDVAPPTFPDRISGWYRVEAWERGTAAQYLQCVVMVWGDPARPDVTNHQLRYILAGTDRPPFGIGNAKFVFLGPREPVTGQWVRFERDLRADFRAQWGRAPESFTRLRFVVEARYDNRAPDSPPTRIEVLWDDLELGGLD